MAQMRYEVIAVRKDGDYGAPLMFIVRGPSLRHNGYGRVHSYAFEDGDPDDAGIRVFWTEGEAWEHAAQLNRGICTKTPKQG